MEGEREILLKPAAGAFKWLISLRPIVNAMARNAHYASPTMGAVGTGCGTGGACSRRANKWNCGRCTKCKWNVQLPRDAGQCECINILCVCVCGCMCACFTWVSVLHEWVLFVVQCSAYVRMCLCVCAWACVCGVLYKFHIYCHWQNMIRKLILLII